MAVTLAAHEWSKKTAALFEQAMWRADHGTCCSCAEADDQLGPDYGHFGVEPWPASNDFNSRRFFMDPSLGALLELEVFHSICDIDVSMPASWRARSKSAPAGPTNGRPARSSLSPGCSPAIMIRAEDGPSPRTA